ncbi:MAG: POTRA domain-containing protein [Ginsengibacter sp.]
MLISARKFSTIFLFCCIHYSVYSQGNFSHEDELKTEITDTASKLSLRKIIVTGNKKTKSYIILREMQVKPGDSVIISRIPDELDKARSFIYNTTLFVDVNVSALIVNAQEFDIIVHVIERWYIFPIPVFQLADRSLNEWVDKHNADLNRVSYGIRFIHRNVSGRNDQFSINVINGYTRNISLNYRAPYSNPSLTEGVLVDGGYYQSREIPVLTTAQNDIFYFRKDDFVRNEWFARGAYLSRKGLTKRETFSLSFHHIRVDDSVISQQYNPGYFNSKSTTQNFPEMEYKLQYINVDNILYPLKGFTSSFILNKRGLQLKDNINRLSLKAGYSVYFAHLNKWYSSLKFSGEIKLPFTQPFVNRRAIGYGEDYLRGYELYVIDAAASAYAKFDLKKQVIRFNIPTLLNSKTYNKIPFRIYAKSFADLGYAYIQQQFNTRLNNKVLCSGGIGIDAVTIYDLKLSIEFSLNQLGQKGLFLHY